MHLARMKLGAKLLAAPSLIGVLMILVGWLGAQSIIQLTNQFNEMVAVRMHAAVTVGSAKEHAVAAKAAAYQQFTAINAGFSADRVDVIAKNLAAHFEGLEGDLTKLSAVPASAEAEQSALAAARQALPPYRKVVSDALSMAATDTSVAANAMIRADKVFDTLAGALDKLVELQAAAAAQHRQHAQERASMLLVLTIAITAVSVVAAAVVTWLVRRNLLNEIRVVSTVAQRLREGVLDKRATQGVKGSDEVAEAVVALGVTMGNLAEMVEVLQSSSSMIATSSQEIAAGNHNLSTRTESLSAATSATRSSVRDAALEAKGLSSTAKDAAHSATRASGLVEEARVATGEMEETVQQIVRSSERIDAIVQVIDGIAFQTNILALNAAVEAARAGETGRGFAVVAGEVRDLALRSQTASKEIKELVAQSNSCAERGRSSVRRVSEVSANVSSCVAEMSSAFGTIASRLGQQEERLSMLEGDFSQLDDIGQQNAALVEQAAAAASSLQEAASRLAASAQAYRVL